MNKFPLVKFESVNRPLEEASVIFEQRMRDAQHIFAKHKNDFVQRSCPVCGAEAYTEQIAFHNTYGVAKCDVCAGSYVNPAPSLAALQDYYNNCECNKMLQKLYKRRTTATRSYIMDDRVENVLDYIKEQIRKTDTPISILEVGCGSGRFLANLKGVLARESLLDNVQLSGIDIDENAVALNDDDQLELKGVAFEEFVASCDRQFDVLLHFELIEHLADPYAFMTKCRKLLKRDALMVFTTPNSNGFEMVASNYNSFRLIAHGIFPPMHLNAFSTHNIATFVIRCGFRIKSITTPGNLDADMVTVTRDQLQEPAFLAFVDLDDDTKGLFQALIKKLGCSSHMMVVARN